MATSKLFKKVPITVPGRSGFNMSHNNFFSAPVGTLVPNFIDFLIPGDEIDLSSKNHVQLPPMATDFYGRVEAKEEAFFVPARILFGGWKDFYVNPVDGITNPSNIDGQLAKYLIGAELSSDGAAVSVNRYESQINNSEDIGAYWAITESQLDKIISDYKAKLDVAIDNEDTSFFINSASSSASPLGSGSLADYLGFKVKTEGSSLNVLPYMVQMSQVLSNSNLPTLLYNNYLTVAAEYRSDGFSQYVTSNGTVGVYTVSSSSSVRPTTPDSDKFLVFEWTRFRDEEASNSDPTAYIQRATIYPNVPEVASGSVRIPNILPFMAYHKIYDDWYRAPMIQQSLFKRNVANQSTATSVANMPWITSGADNKIYFSGNQLKFANGHSLFDLHQRNWQKDYFTSATPEPQAGEASSVKFDIENDSGEFTIASLRAANALQQWLDRNNIGGFRYGDMIYAQYGVYPSDAITDRAIYLGSSSTEVYNKSIYQQSGDGGTDTNNPFNAIGSKYSNPTGIGQGNFCNNYKVTEAGFVIKIFSLVPQAYYSTGVRRFFMHNDISDIAFPVLAGVGDQPIYGYELTDTYSGDGNKHVFGYVQRYADYKFIDDQVHGLLRDGQSLDSFALQRSFSSVPELGSDFLEIPRDYLDQVSATSYKLSQYGCWVNCYNDYRKSSTLPAYSIPTLEDMKGHTVMVDKGGTYLD